MYAAVLRALLHEEAIMTQPASFFASLILDLLHGLRRLRLFTLSLR